MLAATSIGRCPGCAAVKRLQVRLRGAQIG